MTGLVEPAANSFHAVVLDARGRVSARNIDAATLFEARDIASRAGATVLECKPSGASHWRWADRLTGTTRQPQLDALAFAQDLATLVQAGVTVHGALQALARKERSMPGRAALLELAQITSHGASLSAALEQCGVFSELLIATVAASEQTGDLALGLQRYATHQQNLRTVRDRVIGASVYPLLLMIVGSLVVLLLLGVVVPRFSRLLDAQSRDMPLLSKALLAWGQFADAHPAVPLMLLAGLAGVLLYLGARLADGEARKLWSQRIPGVARVTREFQLLQLYRTTAILTSGGIPFIRALDLARDLLGPADRVRLQSALTNIREGSSISAALSQCGLADVMAASMLAVAERSGALAEMLDRIADAYERSLQRSIDIVTRLIEPVLMIVFGLLIGGIVVLMYLPIFDLVASIG